MHANWDSCSPPRRNHSRCGFRCTAHRLDRLDDARGARVERAFEELLHRLTPSRDLITLASHIFRDLRDQRAAPESAAKEGFRTA